MTWYLLMAAIGLYLADGGFRKSDAPPYKFLAARAEGIWKENAHRFLGIIGTVIAVLGIFCHFTL